MARVETSFNCPPYKEVCAFADTHVRTVAVVKCDCRLFEMTYVMTGRNRSDVKEGWWRSIGAERVRVY